MSPKIIPINNNKAILSSPTRLRHASERFTISSLFIGNISCLLLCFLLSGVVNGQSYEGITHHFFHRTHELGLTYSLSSSKDPLKHETNKETAKENRGLYLGAQAYLYNTDTGSIGFGPGLILGYRLKDKWRLETNFTSFREPKEFHIFDGYAVDVNLMLAIKQSNFYLKTGLTGYTKGNATGTHLDNVGVQAGIGILLPIYGDLQFSTSVMERLWRNVDYSDKRLTTGITAGLIYDF